MAIKKTELEDYSEIELLFNVLQSPLDEQAENEKYASYPPEWTQEISVCCSIWNTPLGNITNDDTRIIKHY